MKSRKNSTMPMSLLTTKLYRPPVSPTMVIRSHLIQRLDDGLRLQHRLTLASAPAGFGKTTLLSDWLCHADRPAVWLSLDEADNDLTRFLSYLIAALQMVDEDIGQTAQAMLQASQPPSLDPQLTSLINDISTFSQPFILVLDDYHAIEIQTIHQVLTFLLDHCPPQMHLVIATRADPPLPLARLRGRGQLTELHAADLRFSPEEAAAFLNEAMALDLSAGQVQALEHRTEGWITGLQLAALSIQGRSDVPAFIEAFTGSHRYVLDYLTEEVLNRQTQEVRDFLLHTSILHRFCSGLCDAVQWGAAGAPSRSGSQSVLEWLERNNLFIVPLDGQQQWYRYHHLLADLLRQRLQLEAPHLVGALHRRASDWYERNDLMAEAVSHALTSGDFERAAGLIQQAGWRTLTRGEMATILRWMAALPDEFVRSQPQLSILYAWALAKSGQLDSVEPCLRDVDLDPWPGEASAIRAYVAGVRGDLARAIEQSEKALAHLPEENLLVRAIVAQNLGVAYHWSGNPVAAGRALSQAAQLSRAAQQPFQRLTALAILGRALEMQGALRQAMETYQQALDLASESGYRPVPFAGMACVGMAGVLYEWNDLERAIHYAREGISLSERGGFLAYQVFGYALLARLYEAHCDGDGVTEALEQAERLGQGCDYALVMALASDARVRWWIAHGDLAAAAQWARAREPGWEAELDAAGEIERTTLARVWNAAGQPGSALQLLLQLLDAAEAAGRSGSVIQILIQQAVVQQAHGAPEAALSALERALVLAEPEGYVRAFVDEGAPMAELLRRALSRGIVPDYVRRLLAAGEEKVKAQAGPAQQPGAQPLIDPLTERELEVLRLIAAGLSNREIAQELFIAVSTVKSHVNHLYGKLDVASRTQAIARARTLGLL